MKVFELSTAVIVLSSAQPLHGLPPFHSFIRLWLPYIGVPVPPGKPPSGRRKKTTERRGLAVSVFSSMV